MGDCGHKHSIRKPNNSYKDSYKAAKSKAISFLAPLNANYINYQKCSKLSSPRNPGGDIFIAATVLSTSYETRKFNKIY